MLHLPVLRAGEPYRSIETRQLTDVATGATVAHVSQANRGLISRDLPRLRAAQAALDALPMAELLGCLRRAAALFAEGDVLVDPIDGVVQSPDAFVRLQSATTGMPQALCRRNMEKIRFVLAEMATVLDGLTRGLELSVLDRGWGRRGDGVISYLREADVFGAVLPSNSPGVHSLWLPAIALKVPVLLKPGSHEPWTPLRIVQSLVAAGLPAGAFGFYPTDHAGASDILLKTDRSMVFGDASTVGPWQGDARVQRHGPGWSKVLLADDRVDDFASWLDLMATSIAENGGRACLNASGVWTPRRGRELATALAERLAGIEPRPLDDPEASIAAFAQPGVARDTSDFIDRLLQVPGAVDVSAEVRGPERIVTLGGCTFLRPTIVFCEDPTHPLAASEFLFPFAAVVECPQDRMLSAIGPTLAATVLTDDAAFRAAAMRAPDVDRLNFGNQPTCRVSWDQPHEGNLFEHLYRQRSLQPADAGSAA